MPLTWTLTGKMRNTSNKLFRKQKGSDYLGDLGVNGRTVLQWFLRNPV
jgi:hypothetical protein